MKIRKDRQTSTIIYIPPAHRPIRSLRFYRIFMLIIVLIIVTSLITVYVVQLRAYLHAANQIDWLDDQIKDERAQHWDMLMSKDDVIESLQMDVFDLTQAAESIKKQMNELKQLEKEIRDLSNEAEVIFEDLGSALPGTLPLPDGVGGQPNALSEARVQEWMDETRSTYLGLELEMSHLADLLAHAKDSLQEIELLQRHTPSIWPTASERISSGFGVRKDPFTQKLTMHSGLDITNKLNADINATADGIVEETGKDAVRGNYILIDHSYGLQTLYMHLSKISVSKGDPVTKGQLIGAMGTTGRSTGVHLHYEVHKNGQPVNPKLYLND